MNTYYFALIVPSVAAAVLFRVAPDLTLGKTLLAAVLLFIPSALAALLFSPTTSDIWGMFAILFIDAGAVAAFLSSLKRLTIDGMSMNDWTRAQSELESQTEIQNTKRRELKKTVDNSEQQIVRTLRLYGAVKGLGQSLNWDEMVPHIDYAIQQCLGLKNYQLYLAEGTANTSQLQKVLYRGSRMADAPVNSAARKPRMHQNAPDLYLEVPIFQGNDHIGLLWGRLDAALLPAEQNKMAREAEDLAEELAMGLQKARLFSSLEKLSRVDGLTGVYRRQVFDDRLNEEIRRSKTFRTNFSVLIADLDHFKSINDTLGHQAGDQVLKRVGEIMKESVYETDFVARYGGEEFVILFPQADAAGVHRKAESLRQKVEQENFVIGWNRLQLTISIGIAHYPSDGTDPASLLQTADQCLYGAKDSGRNRVVDSSEMR